MNKYLGFAGTATRSEYWGVYLVSCVILMLAVLFFSLIALSGQAGVLLGAFALIVVFVINVWLMLATTIRRCHDAGINPWFTVLLLVPYIDFIVFIVFGCLSTEKRMIDGSY